MIPVDRGGETEMTFRDFARQSCLQLQHWGYSEHTVEGYDRHYMQFLAYLKTLGRPDDIRHFTDETVLGFAEYLGNEKCHPNTIRRALSSLRALAKFGMQSKDAKGRRLMSEDPTRSFRWPTAQRVETPYLRPDDLRRFLELPTSTTKRLARDLLIGTGLRAGELCRLNVEDLGGAEGRYYLAVRRKGRGQQQRKETRDVPLSAALGDALHSSVLLRGTH